MIINIYCDGGARGNPGPGAGAFVVYDKEGNLLAKGGKRLGRTTNNIAEYNGLLVGLRWILENAKPEWDINVFLDSQLVVNQLTGKFKIKNKNLINLAAKAKEAEKNFSGKIKYYFIPRNKNKAADFLVNKLLDGKNLDDVTRPLNRPNSRCGR